MSRLYYSGSIITILNIISSEIVDNTLILGIQFTITDDSGIFDIDNSFSDKYSITATPTFLIFDKDGSLVKRIEGEISYQTLEIELKNLKN